MAQLRRDFDQFELRDTQIVVVGPESSQEFIRYWREHNLPFVGIPDPRHRILKLFGQEVNLFRLGRMPAQIIIDKQGIVRFVHYGKSMSDIPDNGELLALLSQLESRISPRCD